MRRTTEQWEALLDGTTPGPWEWHGDQDPDMRFIYSDEGGMCMTVEPVGSAYRDADPVLAAAAPDAVAEVIRLREALEVWRGKVKDIPYDGEAITAYITRILEGDSDE